MNLLLMNEAMKYCGIPRNGLQMCLDPYKDCYGKNVLPVGSEKFSSVERTNYSYGGATVTVTPTTETIPDIGTVTAYRIQSSGGLSTLKYFNDLILPNVAVPMWYGSIFAKTNNGVCGFSIQGDSNITSYLSSEWSKVTQNMSSNIFSKGIAFISGAINNDIDIIAWQPQINLGQFYPYALPSGLPLNPLNNYKNQIVQNGSSLTSNSNSVGFTGLSYQMNTTANTDNYLLVAKGGEYDNQSTFTCIFVLNATASGGGYARLFDKAGAALAGILAYVDVNGKINLSRYNGAGNYKTWTTTNAIAWGTTYIVIIKASRNLTDGAVEIFVNGVKQTLTTLVIGTPAIADDSTQDLLLGNRISLDRYFLGDFYSVNWTKKLLSDSEVAGLTKYLKTYWLNKGVTI